ncbi:uncharacterized protein METZ01_LOCUS323489, partial [marine metagenome]
CGARKVVCTDLNEESVAETASLIGGVATPETLDVSSQEAIDSLVARMEDEGGIDIFVSNAGYGKRGGLNLSIDDWKKMMEVHTWAHLYAAQAVIPGMVERGEGYLLNTASAAGLLTQMDSGPYAVSKHAAVALAEWIAINYRDHGIGVSVLCPQAVRTNILANSDGPAVKRKSNSNQAAQDGVLEPEQVADDCIEAIRGERFLVLPHKEVATYFERKASDYDRWLQGMRRFREKLRSASQKEI